MLANTGTSGTKGSIGDIQMMTHARASLLGKGGEMWELLGSWDVSHGQLQALGYCPADPQDLLTPEPALSHTPQTPLAGAFIDTTAAAMLVVVLATVASVLQSHGMITYASGYMAV